LLDRTQDPTNRRQLMLTATDQGHAIVAKVMALRSAALEPMVAAMPPSRRALLVTLLEEFASYGPPPADSDLWLMGWST
jgi:DNA-binding MarR family transcriptional regulator